MCVSVFVSFCFVCMCGFLYLFVCLFVYFTGAQIIQALPGRNVVGPLVRNTAYLVRNDSVFGSSGFWCSFKC